MPLYYRDAQIALLVQIVFLAVSSFFRVFIRFIPLHLPYLWVMLDHRIVLHRFVKDFLGFWLERLFGWYLLVFVGFFLTWTNVRDYCIFSFVEGSSLRFFLLPVFLVKACLADYLDAAVTVTEFEVLLCAISNKLLKFWNNSLVDRAIWLQWLTRLIPNFDSSWGFVCRFLQGFRVLSLWWL